MIRRPRPFEGKSGPTGAKTSVERGNALVELAVVLPFLLLILVAMIDFGHLIQTRLIITNVSREGGSIASREQTLTSALTTMMVASGSPLALSGVDGRVYVTRIKSGVSKASPKPTIAAQITVGSLAVPSKLVTTSATLGLTQRLYDHLVFNTTNNTADIPEITAVEVVYKYRPITPLPNFIAGIIDADGGGLVISSKAVF